MVLQGFNSVLTMLDGRGGGAEGGYESGGSADFIVRLGWNALQLTNPAGKPFDLIGYLQCLPTDQSPHEVNLRASLGREGG